MFETLGGRKFVMAIVIMLIGAGIEFFGKQGLSTNMAGLLTLIYGTFAASNAVITNKQLGTTVSEAAGADPVNAAGPSEAQLKATFSAIDEAYAKMREQASMQAEQINTLQKAVGNILSQKI
jgi:hypothetical protein